MENNSHGAMPFVMDYSNDLRVWVILLLEKGAVARAAQQFEIGTLNSNPLGESRASVAASPQKANSLSPSEMNIYFNMLPARPGTTNRC